MDPGDILSSTIATVSLIATATLAYRQTRMQARLTAIEQTRRREQIEAREHARVQAMVAGTPTALQLVLANDGPATAREVWATELPVGSDDPPLFHGLDELEQAPATLRPGDRLPFPVLTLAETTERVQVVVSWKDEAGPHEESFTVQLPWVHPILIRDGRPSAMLSSLSAGRATP